jgi:hypothetical protein
MRKPLEGQWLAVETTMQSPTGDDKDGYPDDRLVAMVQR